MNELVQYNAARRELELCATLSDTKTALDKTSALAFYAKQNNDIEMEKWVAEIKIRARRKIGELSAGLDKSSGGRNIEATLPIGGKSKGDELKAVGISTSVANRCEKIALIPEKEFEEVIANSGKPVTYADIEKKVLGTSHVSHNSGENEWYTPLCYIESARKVMGSIDLDPATSEMAQATVQAEAYYTAEDDGLTKEWSGNIWMNPPYEKGLVDLFINKLAESKGQYIVLVNNATDTKWFRRLADMSDSFCFPTGRIRFIDKEGSPSGAPLQGQAFLYCGNDSDRFMDEFSAYGIVGDIYHA